MAKRLRIHLGVKYKKECKHCNTAYTVLGQDFFDSICPNCHRSN